MLILQSGCLEKMDGSTFDMHDFFLLGFLFFVFQCKLTEEEEEVEEEKEEENQSVSLCFKASQS